MTWVWILVVIALALAAAWSYDRRAKRRHRFAETNLNGARGQIGTHGRTDVYQQENPRAQDSGGMFSP